MTFTQAVSKCLSNIFTFSGRAPRSEYWWFVLFCSIAVAVSLFIAVSLRVTNPDDIIGAIVFLLTLLLVNIALLGVTVRRLHDIDLSGWFWLLYLFGGLGSLAITIMMLIKGNEKPNKYGPDPLSGQQDYSVFSDDMPETIEEAQQQYETTQAPSKPRRKARSQKDPFTNSDYKPTIRRN